MGMEASLELFRVHYKADLEQIKPEDITIENFKGCRSQDRVTRMRWIWRLKKILLFHPDPIARHEACFMFAFYQISRGVSSMMIIADYDKSIVAVHEALEALGEMEITPEIIGEFLASYPGSSPNQLRTHSDIAATLKRAIRQNKEIQNVLAKEAKKDLQLDFPGF